MTMNSRLLATSLTLLMSVYLPTATAANDHKQYSPAGCQPYGQSSTYDTLAIRADGVQNKTTNTNKYVICPIMHDGEGSWTADTGLNTNLVFAYSGNGTIQCTQTVGSDLGGVLPATSETVNATQLGPYPFLKVVSFAAGVGTLEQAATVTCRLPPQAKLSYISANEDVATDSP
jgi:hypothetical protein